MGRKAYWAVYWNGVGKYWYIAGRVPVSYGSPDYVYDHPATQIHFRTKREALAVARAIPQKPGVSK